MTRFFKTKAVIYKECTLGGRRFVAASSASRVPTYQDGDGALEGPRLSLTPR
jgi:hypothetical protein